MPRPRITRSRIACMEDQERESSPDAEAFIGEPHTVADHDILSPAVGSTCDHHVHGTMPSVERYQYIIVLFEVINTF